MLHPKGLHIGPSVHTGLGHRYGVSTPCLLSDKETDLVQQACGTFLYYAIAIDNTILPTLSYISSEQYKATMNTEKQVAKLLNYLASNPHA